MEPPLCLWARRRKLALEEAQLNRESRMRWHILSSPSANLQGESNKNLKPHGGSRAISYGNLEFPLNAKPNNNCLPREKSYYIRYIGGLLDVSPAIFFTL